MEKARVEMYFSIKILEKKYTIIFVRKSLQKRTQFNNWMNIFNVKKNVRDLICQNAWILFEIFIQNCCIKSVWQHDAFFLFNVWHAMIFLILAIICIFVLSKSEWYHLGCNCVYKSRVAYPDGVDPCPDPTYKKTRSGSPKKPNPDPK